MIYRQKVDCNSILQVQSIGILLMALPSQFPVYPHPPSLLLLLHLRPNSTLCMSPVNGTEHGAPTLSMSPRLSSALLRRPLSQISCWNDRTLLTSCMSCLHGYHVSHRRRDRTPPNVVSYSQWEGVQEYERFPVCYSHPCCPYI